MWVTFWELGYIWKVGFFDFAKNFQLDSTHESRASAFRRINLLNGCCHQN